jgi:hypothetical protein
MYMSIWDVLVLMAYYCIFWIIWIIFCRVLIIVVYEFDILVWHHGFEQLYYVIIDTKNVVLMNAEKCLLFNKVNWNV